jgi:hypothetical protein
MLTIQPMMTTEKHSELIDALGGTTEVARLCRVTSQAVSKWRREGVPEARLMYLQAIRPEVAARLICFNQDAA